MKLILVTALSVLLVGGCATGGDQAKTEGTVGGAAIGAVVGGLLGKAIGDDKKAAAIGAGLGAAIGGAIGYSYADRIARRHEELAGREDDLDAQIDFAMGVNQDTQEYNQSLEREIADLKPKVDELVARINRNEVTEEQLNRERKDLATKVSAADEQLLLAQQELTDLKKFQRTQKSDILDQQITELEANVETLEKNTRVLASQRQRI